MLTGTDYKSGDGSDEVHAWLRLLSRSYALAEASGERQYTDQPHMEVVLLGADSEDAIRATHPTYFRDFDVEPFSLEEVECLLPWLSAQPTPS